MRSASKAACHPKDAQNLRHRRPRTSRAATCTRPPSSPLMKPVGPTFQSLQRSRWPENDQREDGFHETSLFFNKRLVAATPDIPPVESHRGRSRAIRDSPSRDFCAAVDSSYLKFLYYAA